MAEEITSTAQKFLEIFDITDDLLILKDGSTALIITVSAMNFGLLAEEEQDAIIYAYAGLLNSLNYPIQILIRSQTKDVTGYLHLLDEELEKANSDTKKVWIKRYRQFVSDLIKERNVLDKKFYVVLPATALEMGLVPPSAVVPGVKAPDLTSVERSVILDKAKEILIPKRDHMLAQLNRIGLLARQLTTQEIVQLFYLSYNPEAAEGQQIIDTSSYTTPLVQASIAGQITDMQDQNPSPTPNQVTPNGDTPDNQGTPAPAQPTTPAVGQTPAAPGDTTQPTDISNQKVDMANLAPASETPAPAAGSTPSVPPVKPVGTPPTATTPTTPMTTPEVPEVDPSAQSAIDQAAGQIPGVAPANSGITSPASETPAPAAGSTPSVPPVKPVGTPPSGDIPNLGAKPGVTPTPAQPGTPAPAQPATPAGQDEAKPDNLPEI
jgi:hypothetical protein